MEESAKRRILLILTAVIAVASGLALGVAIFLDSRPDEPPEPVVVTSGDFKLDPEYAGLLIGLKSDAEGIREELDLLRGLMADLMDKMDAGPSGRASAEALLPPPYVDQVNRFFRSATARTLLSASLFNATDVKFGDPVFIQHDLLTVPYYARGKEHFLMVRVRVLDYYDLQFDVVWDSLEGDKK